jgi:4,5:9,10-diseco-3-hydroxy-5,9,17-trioxoandrosta-1(10),2-diene-4-oate hydrolase
VPRVHAGRVEELAPGEMTRIEVPDHPAVALFNVGGSFHATQDLCTHARASLTETGKLTDNVIECGWHFGTFDVCTGRALTAPCRQALRTYATDVVDGQIFIEIEAIPARGEERMSVNPPAGSSRFFSFRGERVHYHDLGSGQPVVLLHGAGPGASGWSNFSRNAPLLAREFRLLVVDCPGWGQSDAGDYQGGLFGTLADMAKELLDAAGISRAHFIGNSMGGGTALQFALRYPDRADRLILMAPAGLLAMHTVVPTEGQKLIFSYYMSGHPERATLQAFLENMVYDRNLLTEELIAQRYAESIAPETLRSPPLRADRAPPIEELWRENLRALEHRILMLWGRDDRTVPLDSAFSALKQLRRAELHVFCECGHWVQWEYPDRFNTLALEFLKRT